MLIPNKVVILIDPNDLPHALAERNVVVKSLVDEVIERQKKGVHVEENVRLCEGFTCRLPVHRLDDVEKLVTNV